MEIDSPMRSLQIYNPLEAKACSRCLEPLTSKTQTDACQRCKAHWDGERQRSTVMEVSPLWKLVPTPAEVFASGLATKKRESSSSAQIQYVDQWLVSRPYPATQGGHINTCQPRPVFNNSHADYTKVHDRRLWIPENYNESCYQTQLEQPSMIVTHPTTESFPLPMPTIPHFNAKGEFVCPIISHTIPPSNTVLPHLPIYPLPPHHRRCAQPGCAVTLLPNEGPDVCSKCYMTISQPRHHLFQRHSSPLPSHMPQSNRTAGLIVVSDVVHSEIVPPFETSEDVLDDLEDLELQYPEPENEDIKMSQPLTPLARYEGSSSKPAIPFSVNGVPHHSTSSIESLPPTARHPLPRPRQTIPKTFTSQCQSSSESRPVPSSQPPPAKFGHRCITPECNAILPADSTALRCIVCVKKEWRLKLQAHADARLARPHKRRKTVTWSDILEVDLCASEDVSILKKDETHDSNVGNTQTPVKLKIRIPALRPLNSSLESSTLLSATSTMTNSEASGYDSLISTYSSPPLQETPPTSIVSTSPAFLHSKIDLTHKSSRSLPSKSDSSSTVAAIQGPATLSSTSEDTHSQSISGWDSDLSDLSDLSNLQESDVDERLSDKESNEARPNFKIRIPARPISAPRPDRTRAPKKTIPRYTEYICWSSLLNVFHKRIAGFLEAHQCYKRFKQTTQPAQAVKQVSFKFEGEYSVVTPDFEILGKKSEVHCHTMHLKDEIGHAGGLLFLSTYWVTIIQQQEGVATRFQCKLKSLQRAEMHGELEIAVLPDHSHTFFPGQRTIVRFCLVG